MSLLQSPPRGSAPEIPARRMNEPWWAGLAYPVCALVVGLLLASSALAAPLWTHKPAGDIKWYRVTDVGTVLVGTKGSVYLLDGETGAQLWSRADLPGVEEYEVEEITGTPLLLVSDTSGSFGKNTRLFALDLLTGQSIWQTEKLQGATVAVEPVYEKDLVLLVTVPNNSANKAKPKITALRMTSGELVWEADYPDSVDLYGIERKSRYFPRFDLSGANPPLYDDDSVYFTYAGLHRYSLADGKLLWGVKYDVTEGSIKRSNAQAVIEGDAVYTSAKGQLRAIDKATGAVRWTSKDFGGAVAEMRALGGTVYGRLGGAFYDFSKREYVNKKPFGVAAVNKQTGATEWYYDKASDSITNMAMLPELNTILVADARNLIGLDTASSGKVKEAYKVKLEFKNNLGAAATAAKVAKFGFGGLSAIGKGGGDDRDEPVAVYRRENGTVVVQGKQHILAFDPRGRQIVWSVKYEAPGVPGWQKLAMAGLTAFTYTVSTANALNTYAGTASNRWANSNRLNALVAYEQFVGRRYSAAKVKGNYAYVLTTVKEGKEKGAGLIGVHMESGKGDRQILFKDKEPDYQVDETAGRVFNLRNPKELSAFSVDAAPPAEEQKGK
jgi:outer membrane protein assembly factor BamB